MQSQAIPATPPLGLPPSSGGPGHWRRERCVHCPRVARRPQHRQGGDGDRHRLREQQVHHQLGLRRPQRETGRVTRGGAALDSVLDRYCEAALLVGLAWYYRDSWALFPTLLAFTGPLLVAHVRARGEALLRASVRLPRRMVPSCVSEPTGWPVPRRASTCSRR